MVREPPAHRDTGLILVTRKIPHVTGQLSLVTATEACVPRAFVLHLEEATTMRSPHVATGEISLYSLQKEKTYM